MSAFAATSTAGISYAANVASATRALIAALLSFAKTSPAPAAAQAELESRDRVRQIRALFGMARQYEAVAPSLAAELRYFAGKL